MTEELLWVDDRDVDLDDAIADLMAAATLVSPTDSAKSRGVFPSVFLIIVSEWSIALEVYYPQSLSCKLVKYCNVRAIIR